jgi:hypothetical protein
VREGQEHRHHTSRLTGAIVMCVCAGIEQEGLWEQKKKSGRFNMA